LEEDNFDEEDEETPYLGKRNTKEKEHSDSDFYEHWDDEDDFLETN
jgi:hypothetical protein